MSYFITTAGTVVSALTVGWFGRGVWDGWRRSKAEERSYADKVNEGSR